MPKHDDREYRIMEMTIEERDGDTLSYFVSGYASTFEPYRLGTIEGIDFYERIDPHAFDEADLTDVVFRVDHTGPVYARTSNETVKLRIDDRGLGHRTNLGLTARSRELFEEIRVGNYPRMSFSFKVAPGGEHFDAATHTRIIDRIEKVYDISPVTFPANPGTELSVSARSLIDGAIDAARAERLAALALKRRRTETKARNIGGMHHES